MVYLKSYFPRISCLGMVPKITAVKKLKKYILFQLSHISRNIGTFILI